jgi:hypothetical protein
MFGESDSESPRVPSPWDSLISTSPSPSPPTRSQFVPSPILVPRLVPEADEGNVEYKLQLLAPSPARFARLVTQLKWRLLEGGGQAYYELGVADSGALVGLPREELEQSLETLEMMAGEIGASVIVVKEIEVPAAMAGIAAAQTDRWNSKRRSKARTEHTGSSESSTAANESTTEHSTDIDFEDDLDDLSMTLVLDANNTRRRRYSNTQYSGSSGSLFSMDPDPDPADNADAEPDDDDTASIALPPSVDLEIMSVFKPRPMKARMHTHNHVLGPGKTKRMKKLSHLQSPTVVVGGASAAGHTDHGRHSRPTDGPGSGKHHNVSKKMHRRQMREHKWAEKRKALVAYATDSVESDKVPSSSVGVFVTAVNPPSTVETDNLVHGLESLHVSLEVDAEAKVTTDDIPTVVQLPAAENDEEEEDGDGDDDVFASPTLATPHATFTGGNSTTATYLSVDMEKGVQGQGGEGGNGGGEGKSRLIVEALVVRKMSLDEGFLDFGGFALM